MKNKIINEDCLAGLKKIPDNSIDCCVTSPPYYGLRDYGTKDQIGLEESPEEYVKKLVKVFEEVRRVLKAEGTLWLNIGDTYCHSTRNKNSFRRDKKGYSVSKSKRGVKRWGGGNANGGKGVKTKDLIGIPWMVAFALRSAGWYLRQDIIWNKPNAMPESVTDRYGKAHEHIFLLSKTKKYFFKKLEKRSVWVISTSPLKEAHFAVFPEEIPRICILSGCPEEGTVLDPFLGSGTTAVVARKLNRNYIGFELNKEYIQIAENRLMKEIGLFL